MFHELQEKLTRLSENIAEAWKLLRMDNLLEELSMLEKDMQDPQFWSDAQKAAVVAKRFEAVQSEVRQWQGMKEEVDGLLSLLSDSGAEGESALLSEINDRVEAIQKDYLQKEFYLLFSDRYDGHNALVGIHSGSGGTEAQDWAEMLSRMILRYAEKKGWNAEILDESRGEEAGIKSMTLRISGRFVYGHLKSEHGTHRLVRISPFDADSLRHTSFALIEVVPEVEHDSDIAISPQDLRIDTFMSGGKGGQSVNTTYSAVRIVHLPTGIVVQCQNERSQQQNKDVAMRMLRSKLLKKKAEEEERERLALRGEYKSAEWGNQIRSYVLHPYKMVKDIRTRHESKDPDEVLRGNIDDFIEAYLRWDKAGRPDRRKEGEGDE